VEGDLGIRYNAETIVARAGLETIAGDLRTDFPGLAVPPAEIRDYVERISRRTESVPSEDWHAAADAVLARAAVDLAIARHVGRRERIVTREGEAWIHYGKDLRETPTLIGTGGVFVHNAFAAYILAQRAPMDDRVQALRPKSPKRFLDSSYLLYAVGLLAKDYPDVALRIFKSCMKPAPGYSSDLH
jgi:uncharacterized protein (TIGR01319 family)